MSFINNQVDYKNLKKMTVFDADEKEVGKIIDFCISDDYKLTKFILGGSRIEEFREKIGLKPDNDPIFDIKHITSKSNLKKGKLKLDLVANKMANKLEDEAIQNNETMFSKLTSTTVSCVDGSKVGRVVDAIIYSDNIVDFVLGDNPLVEFFEKIGLAKDYDLLLPTKYITKRAENEFIISKSKAELTLLLKNQKVTDYIAPDQLIKSKVDHKIMQFKRDY